MQGKISEMIFLRIILLLTHAFQNEQILYQYDDFTFYKSS